MTSAAGAPIRVLLVEDHAIVRAGLRLLIESQPQMRVVAEASRRSEALVLAKREQPDVILLDLDLGAENGLELLPELRSAGGKERVLVLTGLRDPEIHRRAIRSGAAGVLLKDKAAETLLTAIEKVHGGEVWIERAMTARLLAELTDGSPRPEEPDPDAAKIASLSPREREIVALVMKGLKNKEIGRRLFISETTVRHHLTSIFDKLGVSDRLELSIFAHRHALDRAGR